MAPDQRVTITIEPAEPDDWIAKARRYTRPKVLAEGWSDEDIERIIKEERRVVPSDSSGMRLVVDTNVFVSATLIAGADLVSIAERIRFCRDPADDIFLEVAVNGQADAVISDDADLLALDLFRGIPIITPTAFARTRLR